MVTAIFYRDLASHMFQLHWAEGVGWKPEIRIGNSIGGRYGDPNAGAP